MTDRTIPAEHIPNAHPTIAQTYINHAFVQAFSSGLDRVDPVGPRIPFFVVKG
jgi:hypothetical protein